MALVLRLVKGARLTWVEMDENFSGLADGTLIEDGAIVTAKLFDGAVTEAKLGLSSVSTAKIADEAVSQAKLGNAAVGSVQLANTSVLTQHLADGNVTLAKMANLAADTVIGRSSSNGVPEAITVTANARALLDDATFSNMRVTLGVPADSEVVLKTVMTANQSLLGSSAANTPVEIPSGMTQLIQPGTVLDFAGSTIPAGYLECDGSNVSRSTYSALYAAIGTTWGSGDGSTTFTLPDLRRRTTIGAGGTATSGPANTLGSVGGAETVTLTTAQIPAHSHSVNINSGTESADHTHNQYTHNGFSSAATMSAATPASNGDSAYYDQGTSGRTAAHYHNVSGSTSTDGGSGSSHSNMQPSVVVKKIIKT